jgi:hypothetical protein
LLSQKGSIYQKNRGGNMEQTLEVMLKEQMGKSEEKLGAAKALL